MSLETLKPKSTLELEPKKPEDTASLIVLKKLLEKNLNTPIKASDKEGYDEMIEKLNEDPEKNSEEPVEHTPPTPNTQADDNAQEESAKRLDAED